MEIRLKSKSFMTKVFEMITNTVYKLKIIQI